MTLARRGALSQACARQAILVSVDGTSSNRIHVMSTLKKKLVPIIPSHAPSSMHTKLQDTIRHMKSW